MPPLSGSWANALKGEFSKDYYKKLFQTVGAEYKTHTIYPPADDIFNAFHFTPLEQVKVVILGQDPYHEPIWDAISRTTDISKNGHGRVF